jgi:uncharacterized membrane protein YdjX (TVP38/TMEM64 family)
VTLPTPETDHVLNEEELVPVQSLSAKARRAWPKLLGLAIWLALLAAYWQYTRTSGMTPGQTVQQLVTFMGSNTPGVLVYILAYMGRPVLFFPATLLTLAGGYLYGPAVGVIVVVIASNLSSLIAYNIGRFFGAGILDQSADSGVLQQYAERLRRNSFETVLIMRLIFLPYDLVSYFAGFLRIRWQGFLLATALGSIPGTISFVLFGASIEGGFTGELPQLNGPSLAVAVLMFIVSLGLSRWFRGREARRAAASSEAAS